MARNQPGQEPQQRGLQAGKVETAAGIEPRAGIRYIARSAVMIGTEEAGSFKVPGALRHRPRVSIIYYRVRLCFRQYIVSDSKREQQKDNHRNWNDYLDRKRFHVDLSWYRGMYAVDRLRRNSCVGLWRHPNH